MLDQLSFNLELMDGQFNVGFFFLGFIMRCGGKKKKNNMKYIAQSFKISLQHNREERKRKENRTERRDEMENYSEMNE